MYIDRIDLSISQEDLQSVMEAFASAAASLELLPSVSPSDRKRYAKLGLKNEALALQIIEVGRANRHLIPAGLDFEKIDRDLLAREQLRTLKVILQGLLDRVSDSMLLTGVDLYAAALSMYHCLRRNADTASLKTTVAELKKGFSRPSRKKKEEPAVPAPAFNTLAERRDTAASFDVRTHELLVRTQRPQLHSHEVAIPGTAPVSSPGRPSPTMVRSAPQVPQPSVPIELQATSQTPTFLSPHYGLPVYLSGGLMPAVAVPTCSEQEMKRRSEAITLVPEHIRTEPATEHLRINAHLPVWSLYSTVETQSPAARACSPVGESSI